jgi:hypothetical protein
VNDPTQPPPDGAPAPPGAEFEPATSFKWVIVLAVVVWSLGASIIIWSRYLSS